MGSNQNKPIGEFLKSTSITQAKGRTGNYTPQQDARGFKVYGRNMPTEHSSVIEGIKASKVPRLVLQKL
jgi:hypothetical protein